MTATKVRCGEHDCISIPMIHFLRRRIFLDSLTNTVIVKERQ